MTPTTTRRHPPGRAGDLDRDHWPDVITFNNTCKEEVSVFQKTLFKTLAMAAVALGLAAPQSSEAAIAVDLALVLAVDVSGSVDATEFALQRDGYVQAFQNAAVQQKIQDGALGQIAVTYVYWSGATEQQQTVPWTLINDAASANTFAGAIAAATRPFSGLTGVGAAINFSANLINTASIGGEAINATREIIDVSGDGTNNSGPAAAGARDAFLAGATDGNRAINGIAIESQSVFNWYVANVQGGPNSFTLFASDFVTFASAINDKLLREIDPEEVVEPGTLSVLGLGLVGLGLMARRRRLAA
ncbi:MAG: DUF1194 domain-containing protein [Rhodospirillales bacterium]|nr:MAG: DUF1194 domain-containing protein [Rhodospirillales bacterium]